MFHVCEKDPLSSFICNCSSTKEKPEADALNLCRLLIKKRFSKDATSSFVSTDCVVGGNCSQISQKLNKQFLNWKVYSLEVGAAFCNGNVDGLANFPGVLENLTSMFCRGQEIYGNSVLVSYSRDKSNRTLLSCGVCRCIVACILEESNLLYVHTK